MNVLLQTALSNALAAGLLVVVVLVITRFWKSAGLRHGLWLLVLVKLITPPLFPVPISIARSEPEPAASAIVPPPIPEEPRLPALAKSRTPGAVHAEIPKPPVMENPAVPDMLTVKGDRVSHLPDDLEAVEPENQDEMQTGEGFAEIEFPTDVESAVGPILPAQSQPEPEVRNAVPVALEPAEEAIDETRVSIVPIVLGVWILGSFLWFLLAASRILRFQRLLRIARPAPSDLQREAVRLARQVGIRNCPPVVVVDGPVSPMLWAFGGRARILFPQELLGRLSSEARETLLLHELAHYRRGDHWVRVLELAVTGLHWWNPIVWWALREIHLAEEECCDGWVVSQSPGNASTYARALVETIAFLAESRLKLPPVASGIGRIQILERRLREIMSGSIRERISTPGRLLLVVLAVCCLPTLPWFNGGIGNASEPVQSADGEAKSSPQAETSADASRVISFTGTFAFEPTDFETTSIPLQVVEQEVRCLAVSKDGKRMIVGHGRWTTPGLVRLWDLQTKKPLASWKRQRGIAGVAYSPDGKTFAAGSWDNSVTFYDAQALKEIRRIQTNKVARIAYSPDGKILATATEGSELKLWDVETGREVRNFGGELFRMQTVCFSKDGKNVAAGGGEFSGAQNGRVATWDVETGKQITVINEHTQPVIGVAFSPDGKTLASGGWDRTLRFWDIAEDKALRSITAPARLQNVAYSPDGSLVVTTSEEENAARIWDPSTGALVSTLPHEAGTIFAGFSPDGRRLYSAGVGKVVREWDVATKKQLAVLEPQSELDETSAVLSVAYAPDETSLASAHDDRTVRIRDAESGQILHVLKGHEDLVSLIAYSPDGKTLATASYDGLVKLWDVNTGKEIKSLSGHENWVFALAFSPDGKTLASGSYDKTVRLWDLETGKEKASLRGHTAAVRSVAFSPDGKTLATGGSDRTVRLWNLETNKESAALQGHTAAVRGVAFSPDGQLLASGSEDKSVKLWDLKTHKERSTLSGHEGMVWCIAFSPGAQTLASAGFDNVIKLWNPADGTERLTLRGHTDVITSLAFAPDMSALLSAGYDASIRLWKSKGGISTPLAVLDRAAGNTAFVAFSPDGRLLATGGEDKAVWLWDLHTGELRHRFTGHEGTILRGVFSSDGKLLATGGYDKTIRLWNVATLKPVATISGHEDWVTALAFSPDGELLASGDREGRAKLWKVASQKIVREFPKESLWIVGAAFSEDGKTLATSTGGWESQDQGHVKLWDVETGRERATLTGSKTSVGPPKFSPDGSKIAAPGWDGSVWIWNVESFEQLAVLNTNSGVVKIAFHPDGKTISGGQLNGEVAVWDLETGDRQLSFKSHSSHAHALAFSPDGSVLATAGHDATIKIWPMTKNPQIRRLRAAGPWTHNVAFLPDGKRFLVSRGPNNSAQLLDRETGREIRRFEGHSRPISAMGVSHDGKLLITGSQDLSVRVWDIETGNQLHQLDGGFEREGRTAAISPDGRFALAGSLDKKTSVWDLKTGKLLHTRAGNGMSSCGIFLDNKKALICDGRDVVIWNVETGEDEKAFSHAQPVVCLDLSPDHKRMVTGTRGNTMWLWDLEAGKQIRRFEAHSEMVRCVAFTPDGKRALSGSYDKTLIVWDLGTGEILGRLLGHEEQVLNVKVSPDGQIAVSGAADYSVRIWDLGSVMNYRGTTAARVVSWKPGGTMPTQDLVLAGEVGTHENGAWFVRYSPDGKVVATGGGDNLVRLWDAASKKLIAELKGHEGSVRCGEFSPDGKLLATGSADKTVKIWNVKEGKLASTFSGHEANVRKVSFSPDGKRVASGGEDKKVLVWDAATLEEVYRIDLGLIVYAIGFSPDGRFLATGGGDHKTSTPGELQIWDAADGRLVQTMSDSKTVIAGLAFSPDSKRLAARDQDYNPSIWNVETGVKLVSNDRIKGVRSLAFSPDGKELAVGNSAHNGFLWVLDSTTGRVIAEKKGHESLIFSVAYSPDGKTLASAGEDGAVKFWKREDR